MKEYIKPIIEEEVIELDDIIAASNGGEGDTENGGQEGNFNELF